jgi:hypothetical protein
MPRKNIVKSKIQKAIEMFIINDEHLISVDASERAITHKLGCYLGEVFRGYDVDCEYNRNGLEQKRLDELRSDVSDTTVYPDIIAHRRVNNDDNLFIIEARKSRASQDKIKYDRKKLKLYKKELRYEFVFELIIDLENGEISFKEIGDADS